MRKEFIDHINTAVEKLNYGNGSKLIRDAIVEKLVREGYRELAWQPHQCASERHRRVPAAF
jgi:Arc/MetJ-type ribon-helix-helix transcriptional regulator